MPAAKSNFSRRAVRSSPGRTKQNGGQLQRSPRRRLPGITLDGAQQAGKLHRVGEGVHHIAFQVKGMQSAVDDFESRGVSLTQKGEYTGGRYAYLDAAEKLGVDIELLEND